MTQEEIIEGNELIAKFMGATELGKSSGLSDPSKCLNMVHPINCDGIEYVSLSELKYHSSWDWLMSVVEEIESLGWIVEIIEKSCAIRCGNKPNRFFETLTICDLKMEAIWSSIVKFIKWYKRIK